MLTTKYTLDEAKQKARALGATRMALSWLGDNTNGDCVHHCFLNDNFDQVAVWNANLQFFIAFERPFHWRQRLRVTHTFESISPCNQDDFLASDLSWSPGDT